ncbi:5214_t:CDS:2, partial [Entrophospora sp. SA101]
LTFSALANIMNPLEHWEMMAITVENFPVYDLSKCHKINSTWKFTKHEARENGVGVTHSGPIGIWNQTIAIRKHNKHRDKGFLDQAEFPTQSREKIANVLENDLYFNSPTEKSQVHPYELPENVRHGHINYLNFDDIDDRLSPCINCFESYQVDEFDQGLAVEEINNETIEDVEDSREIVEQDWNDWTLESGVSVKEMIRKAAKLNGHKLRLECWGIIRCGKKIACPKWCEKSDYLEIQRSCKSKNLYPEHSVMQRENISESSYGLYVINQCLIELFCGEEKDVIYKPGEIILSSVESCRKRKKVVNSYEQKADGAFFTCIKKSLVEIGHLEISGGYNIVDKPRSTWDHLKGAIGNVYMLGELAHCYKKASNEAFSKVQVFFLHAYEKQIELWGMSNPTNGVLLMERISKSFVPIDWTKARRAGIKSFYAQSEAGTPNSSPLFLYSTGKILELQNNINH